MLAMSYRPQCKRYSLWKTRMFFFVIGWYGYRVSIVDADALMLCYNASATTVLTCYNYAFRSSLTHWSLGDLDVISKMEFSVLFHWFVYSALFFYHNALRWMPQDLTDDKSALLQVMAWCHQAASHYLQVNVDPILCHHIASLGHSLWLSDAIVHRRAQYWHRQWLVVW